MITSEQWESCSPRWSLAPYGAAILTPMVVGSFGGVPISILLFCGRQGDRYDSISWRWWGWRVKCLRRRPWSMLGLSTRVSVGWLQGCSKHWMWKPPTWKRAVGNDGLMDTGPEFRLIFFRPTPSWLPPGRSTHSPPEFRLKVAGSLLYLANRNWEACSAKSSAMPFATRGRYKKRPWGRCKLTVVRMLSSGWCMSSLRRRPANWKYLMTGRISPWITTLWGHGLIEVHRDFFNQVQAGHDFCFWLTMLSFSWGQHV